MALIVEYHVVADMYPVGGTAIIAGHIVALNAAGNIIPSPTGGAVTAVSLGIAGDSALAAAGQTTAYSAQLTMGSDGASNRWTENRVSDFYDETTASGKITVYHGGGKFWIQNTLFDNDGATVAINDLLAVSATVAGEYLDTGTAGTEIAIAVGVAQNYPSGVPGTTVDGSMTLGEYIPIVLRI